MPLVSTLNYNASTPNIANAAVVPLGTGGAIRVQADRSFLVRLIARALREHSAGALLAADSGVIEFLLLSILEKINRRVDLPPSELRSGLLVAVSVFSP